MVRQIIISIAVLALIACKSQQGTLLKPFDMNIHFERDSVIMNDTLTMKIGFRNITNETAIFFPKSRIVLSHYNEGFYGFGVIPNHYLIQENYTEIIPMILKPGETVNLSFMITADTSFFNKGVNQVLASYSFESENKIRKRMHKKSTRYYAESRAIKLYVMER